MLQNLQVIKCPFSNPDISGRYFTRFAAVYQRMQNLKVLLPTVFTRVSSLMVAGFGFLAANPRGFLRTVSSWSYLPFHPPGLYGVLANRKTWAYFAFGESDRFGDRNRPIAGFTPSGTRKRSRNADMAVFSGEWKKTSRFLARSKYSCVPGSFKTRLELLTIIS